MLVVGRMPKMWYRRKSKVGIAPGAHRAGLLHESAISRAVASQMTATQWAASAAPREDRLVDSLLFTINPPPRCPGCDPPPGTPGSTSPPAAALPPGFPAPSWWRDRTAWSGGRP